MTFLSTVRHGVATLLHPLPGDQVIERESARTRLVFGALVLILVTVPLLDPGHVNRQVAWAVALAVAATGVASLLPVCWPALNRIGGLVLAAEIAALVAATGAADSPYSVLYGMLLVYGTVFYGTRRLLMTAAVLTVLYLAPHAVGMGPHSGARWTDLGVEMGVWAMTAAVVHRLVVRNRERSRELRINAQRYQCLFTHNPNGVFSLDVNGRFTTMNAAGGRLLGVAPEEVVGRGFQPFVAADELPAVEQRLRDALHGASQRYELTVLNAQGGRVAGAVVNMPILVDGTVVGVHGIIRDLSETKALLERLEHRSLHDALTGLANRTLLMDRLDHALSSSQRAGHPVAALVIDLDGFKPVNDLHGHHVGDALLLAIAARMASCSRPADTLARLGGDEFAFVLQQADGRAAAQVAQRIIEAVAMPVSIGDAEVVVGASVGIAVSASDAQDGEQLLRDADEAMYAAKRNGRGQHVLFTPELALQRESSADPSMTVACGDARAWADYIRALRAEIADRKGTGSMPEGARAPASVFRILENLLEAIDALPQEAAVAQLGLPPDKPSLEEFFFHQTMVDAWAASLVDRGAFDTRRPPQARRFWADLEAALDVESSATLETPRASPVG